MTSSVYVVSLNQFTILTQDKLQVKREEIKSLK